MGSDNCSDWTYCLTICKLADFNDFITSNCKILHYEANLKMHRDLGCDYPKHNGRYQYFKTVNFAGNSVCDMIKRTGGM